MTDEKRDFALQQYEMLEKEALEIHARSDRLEQIFAAAYGALYAFYFKGPQGTISVWFLLVPCFIAGFAMIRLDLLSHVRRIIRAYQLSIERKYPLNIGDEANQELEGKVAFFDKTFYGESHSQSTDQSGAASRFLFIAAVSDRAKLWRILFWVSCIVFLLSVPRTDVIEFFRSVICTEAPKG